MTHPNRISAAVIAGIIERLEKATEGSRVLDGLIAEGVFDYAVEWSVEINPQPCDQGGNYLPEFSRSIDAALTLVPERFGWDCGAFANICTAGVGRYHARASTVPLALCIAALRAREVTP